MDNIQGAHIVEWKGFAFLIQILIVCQLGSLAIFWWLRRLYWRSQQQKLQKQQSPKNNAV